MVNTHDELVEINRSRKARLRLTPVFSGVPGYDSLWLRSVVAAPVPAVVPVRGHQPADRPQLDFQSISQEAAT